MDELLKYMKALVLFQVAREQELSDRTGRSRLESVLASAGFSHKEIADMVGKTPAAVAKSISRARAASKKSTAEQLEQEG